MKPVILDRSTLEKYATCPQQAYLSILFDFLKAEAKGEEVNDWERSLAAQADPDLISRLKSSALYSTASKSCDIGTQIHELIEQSFIDTTINGQIQLHEVPQWFVDKLPTLRPDIQPMAIRHARHIGDQLADLHVAVIGLEQQVSVVFLPETATRPAIIVTMRYDLLGSGIKSVHCIDWKTGYKKRTNDETADSFQAQFGAWLMWQQPEYKDVNKIHFWYYETLWGSKSYACFDRDEEHPRLPGLSANNAIYGRVRETVELFLANNQEAWPMEDKCCWCDMISFCKYASMDAKAIDISTKEYVDKMIVDEESLKRRRKAAVEWIKAKGPLVGTKVTFAKKEPTDRFTCDFIDNAKPKGPASTGDAELDSHFKR
jgi:hypothetical protein